MKKSNFTHILFFIILVCGPAISAQTPTTCFEIESILVDACGSPEEENEMVRFVVGPTALNTGNLTVSWPNTSNPFRGMCQNATTANKVAALNATIQGCGYLKEPVGGVLPAGAKVLFFTDVLVSTTANSFTNLNDTLYAIFQCSGNSSGHFVNYDSNPGIRTLTMIFSSPSSCSDQVTYDRSLLVNQNGNPGGSSALLNGGRVDYAWNGTATYDNDGCQAPFIPLTATAGSNFSICTGTQASLNGDIDGNFSSVSWSGGSGVFSDQTNDTTMYTPGVGETGPVVLTMTVTSPCNDVITSSLTLTIETPPVASITFTPNDTVCAGTNVTLNVTGGSTYSWSPGSSTLPSIQVAQTGTYTSTASNNCGTSTAQQFIQVNPLPATSISASGPLTFCSGSSVTLTASGADTYLWLSDGSTGTSLVVTQSGTYTVRGTTNTCGSLDATETVIVETLPSVQISGPTSICSGTSVVLTASGAGNGTYTWLFDGSNGTTLNINQGGSYIVEATNNCGSDSETLVVNQIQQPDAVVTGEQVICNGENASLFVTGGDTYLWSTGETTQAVSILTSGPAYAVAYNACGNDTAHLNIIVSSLTSGFTTDTLTGTAPLPVNFTNASTNATSYSWNFADGGTSAEASPSHTFTEAGSYFVILQSSNSSGCTDSSSITIIVREPISRLEIPNVFTPNSDSRNDVFAIDFEALAEFQCDIFNRWGTHIAGFSDASKGWDGRTDAGEPAPAGTYFYIIKAKGLDNKEYTRNDSFMLLR